MPPAENVPPGAFEPASELLFQHLLQHLFVQTQVSHKFLQALIFILQLPQTPKFRYSQTGEFLLPVIIKWPQKCPSFCRLPRCGCRFQPASVQMQSVLRYNGSFSWRCASRQDGRKTGYFILDWRCFQGGAHI